MEDLPPSYTDACSGAAPLFDLPCSRQEDTRTPQVQTLTRLSDEIQDQIPELELLYDSACKSKRLVDVKHEALDTELSDRKHAIIARLQKLFRHYRSMLYQETQAEMQRLTAIKTQIASLMRSAHSQSETARVIVKTGNPHDLVETQERLVQKIQEIKTTIENTAAFHSVCSEWSYQYGNIQDHDLNYCVGNLKVPPFMPLEMQGASAQSVFQESPRRSMSRNDSVQSDVQPHRILLSNLETFTASPNMRHRSVSPTSRTLQSTPTEPVRSPRLRVSPPNETQRPAIPRRSQQTVEPRRTVSPRQQSLSQESDLLIDITESSTPDAGQNITNTGAARNRLGSTTSPTIPTTHIPMIPTRTTSTDAGHVQISSSSTTGTSTDLVDTGSSSVEIPDPEQLRQAEAREIADIPNYRLLYSFNTKTYIDKARCHPLDFVITEDGLVVVADKFNAKLKVFTERGQLIREITSPLLQTPACVQLTTRGDYAVCDTESKDIKIFSPMGALLGTSMRFTSVTGLAVTSYGEFVIGDAAARSVHVLDHNGSIRLTINMSDHTEGGNLVGYFLWPHYVTIGKNDSIIVADRAANKVMVFSRTGKLISKISGFKDPYGVTYNKEQVTVADYSHHSVRLILSQRLSNTSNKKACTLLGADSHLKFPTAVAYTSDGRLMVSEYLSGLIKVFGTDAHIADDDPNATLPMYASTEPPPTNEDTPFQAYF